MFGFHGTLVRFDVFKYKRKSQWPTMKIKGMQWSLGVSPEKEWGFGKAWPFVWISEYWNDENVDTKSFHTSVLNGDGFSPRRAVHLSASWK